MPMRDIEVLIGDLEFHTGAIEGASSSNEARRAIDSALALVYRLQDALKTERGDSYWQDLDTDPDGRIVGALNLARNMNTHTRIIESGKSELVPSDNLFLGDGFILGDIFRWADYGDIEADMRPPAKGNRDRRADYRMLLSQRPVAVTLRRAIEFYRLQARFARS